jgi:polyisoprenoid-binding protein YceI
VALKFQETLSRREHRRAPFDSIKILRRQQMKKFLAMAGLAVMMAAPSLAATSTWNLDPMHSNAQFTVRHLGISNVQGEFTKISGTVMLDDSDITKSSVDVTIDATSVDTRVSRRDDDLKSDGFFDVAKFPTITFKSTKVEKAGDGKLKVTGDLTLKGVTKSVVLEVTGPSGIDTHMGTRRGFSATTTIDRTAFGVSKDPAPMVGNDIAVQIDCEMVLPAPAK